VGEGEGGGEGSGRWGVGDGIKMEMVRGYCSSSALAEKHRHWGAVITYLR